MAGSLRVAGRRLWVYGRCQKDVAEKLAALRRQQVQGTLVDPSKLTMADYLQQ